LRPRSDRWVLGGLTGAVVLSRWLLRAQVADDYDSFGFLLGISQKYDLARFQPQFPGYPVYVALGAALHRLGLSALPAAEAISAVASGVGGAGLAICARSLAGARAGITVLALHLVAWLPWLLGGGALSEPLGMAFAIAAFALLALEVPRFGASGLCAGLLLGTRASYWPLVVSLFALALVMPLPGLASGPTSGPARGPSRYRVFLGAASGVLVWAVPFLAVVGVRNVIELGTTHVSGHFNQWGGTVVTRPDLLERLHAFARGLCFDGVAPSPWALAGGALAVAAAWLVRRRQKALGDPFDVRPVLVALVPYGLWAFLAQNIVEQPRHLLPLVEGELLLLGCFLAPHRLLATALCLIMACASAPLAYERHRVPPAAAQAAAWVMQHERPERTFIAAGRSSRFFEALAEPFPVRQHVMLGDVIGSLVRSDRLPEVILVTSEIDLHSGRGPGSPLPNHWGIEPGPSFCRDARIDRAQPCLGLSRLVWSFR
jgi:hypothetical protein